VCRKCVRNKIDDMSLPSLRRHYSVSSVVRSDPTPCSPFDILPCDRWFVILSTERTDRVSQVAVKSLYNMPGSATPGERISTRHLRRNACCLPYFRKRRPLRFTLFEAQSLSGLLPGCLRLTSEITSSRSRLAIGGLALTFPSRISTC
jgi:hypothetical protein